MEMFNAPATFVENYKQKRIYKRVYKGDMKRDLGEV